MRHLTRAQFGQVFEDQLGIQLPDRPEQGIYEQSAIQNFRIGARKKENGRVFRYAYTVTGLPAVVAEARLVINSNYAPEVTGHVNEDGFMGNITFAGIARTVPVPVGAAYLDIADTVARAVNWYQGGYCIIFDDVTPYFHQHYIIASALGTGTYVRIYLDHPTGAAIPVLNAGANPVGITAYRSPYSAVAVAGSVQVGFEPFIGMPLCGVIPALRYFWLMTAGPLWVAAHGAAWPGAAADQRDVYAHQDGTIDPASQKDPTAGYQKVGYLLPMTGGTASDYGDAWIMLQLDQ
jgi:hypothetical protein